jgi:phosphomevalonate kinase
MNRYFAVISVSFWYFFANVAIAQNREFTPQLEPNNNNIENIENDRLIPDNIDRNYIGLQYQKLPQGLIGLGGWVIGDAYAPTIFGISKIQQTTRQMLWLEIITNDPDGKARYQVLDILELPQLEANDEVTTYCRFQGKIDPEIVTVSVHEDREFLTNIKQAWRANRKTGKFEVFPIDSLICLNIGYGA